MGRSCHNWIQKYIEFYGPVAEAPEPYHFWSAATVVGAVLKRHVWIDRGTYRLFPNLYTCLIGRPGIGKGSALNPAVDILNRSSAGNFISGRITIQWVLEKLGKGFVGPIPSNGQMSIGTEAALLLFSPEFNVFVSASQDTLRILTDLWDSREGVWDYGTRHAGEYRIKDPCVSMLAGCTPDALIELIPSQAIGGGFTRRVNFVFARDNASLIPWPNKLPVYQPLVDDLRRLLILNGEFRWEPSAKAMFESYYQRTRGNNTQDIKDEATANYETTMHAHASKLAMVLSIARSDDLVITTQDWLEATKRVDGCAETVKKVFRSAGSSDLAFACGKVLDFLEIRGFATRQDILAHNWQTVTSADLDTVLATLTCGGEVVEFSQGGKTLYRMK